MKSWIALHAYCSDVPKVLIDLHELMVVRNESIYLYLATRTHGYRFYPTEEVQHVILAILKLAPGETLSIKSANDVTEEARIKTSH